MTTEPVRAGGDAGQALSLARDLAERVRRAQRGTWFPLVLFAGATFAAIPVDRLGQPSTTCRSVDGAGSGLRVCTVYTDAALVYWPIALVLAYVAIAAFYLRRSRNRGVGTRVQPYVLAGVVVALLLTGASFWQAHHPPPGTYDILGVHLSGEAAGLPFRLVGPGCAIGLALLVLAWAERSRALLVVTLGYLVIVLAPIDFGWTIAHPSRWAFLPHLVIDGGVLLLAGIGFAVAQRAARRSHP
jgi:hypothetical protein